MLRGVQALAAIDLTARWVFARPQAERDPRLGCKPVSVAQSGSLERMARGQPLESPRRCARWGAVRQAQTSQEWLASGHSHDHGQILDDGDAIENPSVRYNITSTAPIMGAT